MYTIYIKGVDYIGNAHFSEGYHFESPDFVRSWVAFAMSKLKGCKRYYLRLYINDVLSVEAEFPCCSETGEYCEYVRGYIDAWIECYNKFSDTDNKEDAECGDLATIDEVSDEGWQLALELIVADCLATIAENTVCVGEYKGVVSLHCNCGDMSHEIVNIDWLDTHDKLKEKVAKIRMAGWYVEDVAIDGCISTGNLQHFLRSLGDAGGELKYDEFGYLHYTPNIMAKRLKH